MLTLTESFVLAGDVWLGFFDATFTLVVEFQSSTFTCYSDRYFYNIGFAHAVDTGSTITPLVIVKAGAAISSSPRDYILAGAIECRFWVNNRSARIVMPYPRNGNLFLRRSEVANIGETVELALITNQYLSKSKLKWRHNGLLVQKWEDRTKVDILGVQPADAGIYECYDESSRSSRQGLVRLIVRKCEKNRYGANCEHECPVCYNGGVCHDLLGMCICPAGFIGKNCELACGQDDVSDNCGKLCIRTYCKGKLFCKPDPYGCSCFPGFKGILCDSPCEPDWYGAGCSQRCHCKDYRNCNMFTGNCSDGCYTGWTGESCQIKVVN